MILHFDVTFREAAWARSRSGSATWSRRRLALIAAEVHRAFPHARPPTGGASRPARRGRRTRRASSRRPTAGHPPPRPRPDRATRRRHRRERLGQVHARPDWSTGWWSPPPAGCWSTGCDVAREGRGYAAGWASLHRPRGPAGDAHLRRGRRALAAATRQGRPRRRSRWPCWRSRPAEHADDSVHSLSGGQRQLARARRGARVEPRSWSPTSRPPCWTSATAAGSPTCSSPRPAPGAGHPRPRPGRPCDRVLLVDGRVDRDGAAVIALRPHEASRLHPRARRRGATSMGLMLPAWRAVVHRAPVGAKVLAAGLLSMAIVVVRARVHRRCGLPADAALLAAVRRSGRAAAHVGGEASRWSPSCSPHLSATSGSWTRSPRPGPLRRVVDPERRPLPVLAVAPSRDGGPGRARRRPRPGPGRPPRADDPRRRVVRAHRPALHAAGRRLA